MTTGNFKKCLELVLRHEGGNDDDPRDPGGRTSRGITQKEYNSYRKGMNQPQADVWAAPQTEIENIYRLQYWEPWGTQLPAGVDYLYFDMNVNMGPAQAAKLFQRALGITADGHMGVITLEKINDCNDLAGLISAISEKRRAFYRSLKTFKTFGRGWIRRTDEVERDAIKMVPLTDQDSKVMAVSTGLGDGATVKASATDADVQTVVSPETAGATSAGLGGASSIVNEIQQQLAPFSDTLVYIKYGLMVLALVGVGIMVLGILKRSRAKEAMA